MASKTGWSPEKLENYETGKTPIPLPELEQLSSLLNQTLKYFFDRQGLVGAWTTRQQRVKQFLTLPDELQDFVSKPVNQPFLELAQRLNEMPVDKLRAIAEGLLEITL